MGQYTVYSIRNLETKKIVPCTQHSIFWGFAGSHPHTDSSKNMGFLAPAYPRPPFAAAACGGADNGDAPVVATMLEPLPYPKITTRPSNTTSVCAGTFNVRATVFDHHTTVG